LARNAGLAIAQKPGGTAFNPLMVFGGCGLGKTHLAHAIGNLIKQTHKQKKLAVCEFCHFLSTSVIEKRST
jgi:chromosomal replication initiator protein